MNWLHFCDFHIGGSRAPQENAISALLETVADACVAIGKPVDAVFLAGDLAYSGKASEFATFSEIFLEPLLKIPAIEQAKIFAVPGNHDIDCRHGVPISWDTIHTRHKDIFFAEDREGQLVRKQRIENFSAYTQFIKSNGIYGPNPELEVSKLYDSNDFPNFPIAILATNTAFFSHEQESKYPHSIPVPLTSFRSHIERYSQEKPLLILGHHSFQSFRKEQLKQFKALLGEKGAFYIHGHEHEPSIDFNSRGCLLNLGFGATYTGSLEGQNPSAYVNSFTHCELSDRLNITSYSWRPEAGRWIETTALQFPECDVQNDSTKTYAMVNIPKLSTAKHYQSNNDSIASIPRSHPKPHKIVPLANPNEDLWKKCFQMSLNIRRAVHSGPYSFSPTQKADGKFEAILTVDAERHLVVCIPGLSHILAEKEVEAFNTRLDMEDLASVTVISFGNLSDDARTMYMRLQERKQIEILINSDVISQYDRLLSAEQIDQIRKLDSGKNSVQILASEQDLFCLVIENQWPYKSFYILGRSGTKVSASSEIVAQLRTGSPEFEKMAYVGEVSQGELKVGNGFDEHIYLSACYREFNTLKYAALANVGIRFSDLPLKDLYVDATASESAEGRAERLEAIIDDHLSSFPASDALKRHARNEMLASIDSEPHHETSDAREFCQQYNAVLLTGDPGAGKTCFVKNEILSYCERGLEDTTSPVRNWHSMHVPIMVQLSEVVGEKDLAEVGLFVVVSRLMSLKGLTFPQLEISKMATEGRLAIFFDGLDEVVSIEKRAMIVRHINEFVEKYIHLGNRVVVTSRPAAVHVVNLLPNLHKLEIQGLSKEKVRMLAERILSLRIIDTPDGGQLDQTGLRPNDNRILRQLLDDCHKNPGVERLAQNPLLLTLLILIYANSGAPSAKRHRIYEEAIKTLSSVRGREANFPPISDQDLRERLGAVALAVYRGESGLLPTRSEVRSQIQTVMSRQRKEPASLTEADEFIQKVAESTGLITVGGRGDPESEHAVVSFMHHSFLEYFAAIGLSQNLEYEDLEALVHEPRWYEILTLLSGIIGENADVAPILSRVLQSEDEVTEVNGRLLAFAMDCALENEIPSEAVQRMLASAVYNAVNTGPARLDRWVQSEIGRRLHSLFRACGPVEFVRIFQQIVEHGTDDEAAASIRILGYASTGIENDEELEDLINRACKRNSENVVCAICWAASQASVFRTETTLQIIANSLKRGARRRQSGFEAIAKMPGLAPEHWAEIINGIDDESSPVRRAASLAAVQAGVNADLIAMKGSRKDVILRALRSVDEISEDLYLTRIKRSTLEQMLRSGEKRTRILGIGLLPMVDQDERYVYENLLSIIEEQDDREEIVAALVALRYSGETLSLFKVSDLNVVSNWTKDGTADVRTAAIRLLGLFGRDVPAVEALLGRNLDSIGSEEYIATMYSFGSARVLKERIAPIVAGEVERLAQSVIKMNDENVRRTCACLDALRRLEETLPDRCVRKIRGLYGDFRVEHAIRARALLTLPAVAMPSAKMVKMFTDWISQTSIEFEAERVQIPAIFSRKCRQSVDYVIACISSLKDFRRAAISLHQKCVKREATRTNELLVSELRNGIEEITRIIVAFEEFIEK